MNAAWMRYRAMLMKVTFSFVRPMIGQPTPSFSENWASSAITADNKTDKPSLKTITLKTNSLQTRQDIRKGRRIAKVAYIEKWCDFTVKEIWMHLIPVFNEMSVKHILGSRWHHDVECIFLQCIRCMSVNGRADWSQFSPQQHSDRLQIDTQQLSFQLSQPADPLLLKLAVCHTHTHTHTHSNTHT